MAGSGAAATGLVAVTGEAALAVVGLLGAGAGSATRTWVGTAAEGGLTVTTTPDGGTTVTAGRVDPALTGALAITGPEGGREAMAGVGWGIMAGAGRACGTIFLGAGGAGGAGGAATAAARGSCSAGALGGGCTARIGTLPFRASIASASASCFWARMAFITSPGLETWDKSILGVMDWAPREDAAPLCPAGLVPRSNCARTFSAS